MAKYPGDDSPHCFCMPVLFFSQCQLELVRARKHGVQARIISITRDYGALGVSSIYFRIQTRACS
jgi:hypothetical protein